MRLEVALLLGLELAAAIPQTRMSPVFFQPPRLFRELLMRHLHGRLMLLEPVRMLGLELAAADPAKGEGAGDVGCDRVA